MKNQNLPQFMMEFAKLTPVRPDFEELSRRLQQLMTLVGKYDIPEEIGFSVVINSFMHKDLKRAGFLCTNCHAHSYVGTMYNFPVFRSSIGNEIPAYTITMNNRELTRALQQATHRSEKGRLYRYDGNFWQVYQNSLERWKIMSGEPTVELTRI